MFTVTHTPGLSGCAGSTVGGGRQSRRGAEPVSEQEAAPRLGLAPAWLGSSRTPPDFRRRGRTRSSTERASNIWASRASGLRSSPPNPVDRGVLAADLRDRPPARLPRQGSHEERRSDRPARRTTRPDTPGLDTLSAACATRWWPCSPPDGASTRRLATRRCPRARTRRSGNPSARAPTPPCVSRPPRSRSTAGTSSPSRPTRSAG